MERGVGGAAQGKRVLWGAGCDGVMAHSRVALSTQGGILPWHTWHLAADCLLAVSLSSAAFFLLAVIELDWFGLKGP